MKPWLRPDWRYSACAAAYEPELRAERSSSEPGNAAYSKAWRSRSTRSCQTIATFVSVLSGRAGTRRGPPIVRECQSNLAIAQEAIELKRQIAASVQPLHDDDLVVTADDKLTLSAWRSNIELHLPAGLGRNRDHRRLTRRTFGRGGDRSQGCQQGTGATGIQKGVNTRHYVPASALALPDGKESQRKKRSI
jgi:hypothetical protein